MLPSQLPTLVRLPLSLSRFKTLQAWQDDQRLLVGTKCNQLLQVGAALCQGRAEAQLLLLARQRPHASGQAAQHPAAHQPCLSPVLLPRFRVQWDTATGAVRGVPLPPAPQRAQPPIESMWGACGIHCVAVNPGWLGWDGQRCAALGVRVRCGAWQVRLGRRHGAARLRSARPGLRRRSRLFVLLPSFRSWAPAGDMVATGGAEPADCAVLSLPDLKPVQTLVVSCSAASPCVGRPPACSVLRSASFMCRVCLLSACRSGGVLRASGWHMNSDRSGTARSLGGGPPHGGSVAMVHVPRSLSLSVDRCCATGPPRLGVWSGLGERPPPGDRVSRPKRGAVAAARARRRRPGGAVQGAGGGPAAQVRGAGAAARVWRGGALGLWSACALHGARSRPFDATIPCSSPPALSLVPPPHRARCGMQTATREVPHVPDPSPADASTQSCTPLRLLPRRARCGTSSTTQSPAAWPRCRRKAPSSSWTRHGACAAYAR